jgi:alginate O-acetyltransferase complex protein AlgI
MRIEEIKLVSREGHMLFFSLPFLLFFLIVFTSYWAMPWHRGRVLLLLGASIYFYSCWNHWLALILCVSTLADFLIARGMEATADARVKKLLLMTSLVGNLGLLCYFKYANFFIGSLMEAAHAFGLTVSLPMLQVVLPVGISFYTFEAINYTVDVYRGKVRAAHDLTHFMLFILFFPHLIAGPIVRARAFLPLVARRKHWSWLRANMGVQLFLLGLVKKLAIAERIAAYVDPVFADPAGHTTWTLWLATFAYTIQIYCDFSGYSDMALGLAHLFGYHLAQNFNLPFLAPNISELWQRWHMSLSTWIRDYVFLPLGGFRGTRLLTYRNLLITFTLCGLWHGAGWNYVLWGFITGLMLVIHVVFKSWCKQLPRLKELLRTTPGTALRIAFTFTCFSLTGVFFRCPEVATGLAMYGRMFSPAAGLGFPLQAHGLYLTLAAVAIGHALGHRHLGLRFWERLPAPMRGLAFGASLTLALVLAPGASKAFIYFQF